MRLSEVLDKNSVLVDLSVDTKERAIADLVSAARVTSGACDRASLLTSILERERVKSTALGGGVAIPHARCPALRGLAVALGLVREGMDCGTCDGTRVYVFLLVGSEEGKEAQFLRLISHAAALFKDESFVRSLATAETPAQALKLIDERETRCESKPA
jgi:mannitol/fructose-specific phosphotransferase system IIA component (Ntr-type)